MVSFGAIENAYDYQNEASGDLYAIFDSGSSTINVPAKYFANFIDLIFEQMADGSEYKVVEGFVMTKCYTDFPDLWF